MPAVQPPLNINQAAQYSPPVTAMPALSAPLLSLPPASKADVTGSVMRTPANRPPQPATQPAADHLPAAIAGPRLRTAALSGDAGAAYEIAMRFSEGRGVPANLDEAAHWYELAASKGLTPAQFRYASMLEKGQGVKKDLESARKLYVAAAGKGHAKAMHNLAVLYAEGIDGKPDYASAAQWFRKAAEHGVADSQYNLGVLAARGIGMDRNIGESYKWFSLAAAQGDKDAGRKRDELAMQLDAQTLASIQQALKSYTAQAQPAEAITIPEPQGGWDRTPPAPEKPRAGGPLPIGAFNSGKL
jgi:localization factor PodJL